MPSMANYTKADLAAVLREYEQWEADLIMDSEAWRHADGEPRDLPWIPQHLWDRLIEIQERRNAALAALPKAEQPELEATKVSANTPASLPQDHPTDIFMQLRRMAIAAGVDPRDARVLTDRFLEALAVQNGEVARDIAVERGWIEEDEEGGETREDARRQGLVSEGGA